jgi:exodeoxyribonuclease-3
LIAYAGDLRESGAPVALVGDYNVVPTDGDIYAMRSWRTNALVQPEPRAAFVRLVAAGWSDIIRERHPVDPMYTFWDYKRDAWPRDAGMRLDHLLLSVGLAARTTAAGVDRAVRGRENASDHAPAWVSLTD